MHGGQGEGRAKKDRERREERGERDGPNTRVGGVDVSRIS